MHIWLYLTERNLICQGDTYSKQLPLRYVRVSLRNMYISMSSELCALAQAKIAMLLVKTVTHATCSIYKILVRRNIYDYLAC